MLPFMFCCLQLFLSLNSYLGKPKFIHITQVYKMYFQTQVQEMNKIYQNNQDYVLCFDEDQPESLVVLQNADRVLEQLLAVPEQIMFVWVHDNLTKQQAKTVFDIQSELKIQISKYYSLSLLINQVQQSRFQLKILVVCSPEAMLKLVNLQNIKYIVCYPCEEQLDIQIEGKSIYYPDNEQQLKKILKIYKNQNSKIEYLWLPNFLNLNTQVARSNTMVLALWAMLNYKRNTVCCNQLLDQLQKLLEKVELFKLNIDNSQNNIGCFSQFLQQLRKGQLSCKRSIYWYTLESPIFKFINNFLRSAQNSCSIFYVQAYFKNLFDAVSTLHKTQKQQRQFTCYRGGKITKQEADRLCSNIGGIIQNLGFLSTSTDKQVTEMYKVNVLFEIIVDETNNPGQSLGYANIAQYSNYAQQSEIIFNPLNFFTIISVKTVHNQFNETYQVQLKFTYPDYSKGLILDQEHKLNNQLIKRQSDFRQTIKYQGQALVIQNASLKQGQIYWQKFIQLAGSRYQQTVKQIECIKQSQQQKQKIAKGQKRYKKQYEYGIRMMSQTLKQGGKIQQAASLFEKVEESLIQNQKQGNNQKNCYQILCSLAKFSFKRNQNEKSIKYLTKLQQIAIKLFGFQSQQNIQIIKGFAFIERRMRQVDKAMILLDSAAKMKQKLDGGLNNALGSSILFQLGKILQAKGNLQKAIIMFEKSLKIIRKIRSCQRQQTDILQSYTRALLFKGQFVKARNAINQLYSIMKKRKNFHEYQEALLLTKLGHHLYLIKQFQKALQCCRKSYQKIKSNGWESQEAFWLNFILIGLIYKEKNMIDNALAFYQKASQLIAGKFGKNSLRYSQSLLYIATVYIQKGQADEALKLLITSQYILQSIKEQLRQQRAQLLFKISLVYQMKRQFNNELACLEKCLKLWKSLYGQINFNIYPVLNNIAKIQLSFKNFSRVYYILRESEFILLKYCRNYVQKYADLLTLMATVEMVKGFLDEALKLEAKSAKMLGRKFGKQNFSYFKSFLRLICIYKNKGFYGKSLILYKKALNLTRQKFNQIELQVCKKVIQIYNQTSCIAQRIDFVNKNKETLFQNINFKQKNKIDKLLKWNSKQIFGISFAEFG